MAPRKILCVAEKPSIAKAVAEHLAGGRMNNRGIQGSQFVKNYEFDFDFRQWGNCSVTMTSVLGHLTGTDFEQQYKKWHSCPPSALFEARIVTTFDDQSKAIAKNIAQQARYSQILFIWTDCDREGEYIGTEIRTEALKGNSRIEVRRAIFNNIERNHVREAAQNPEMIDERQAKAVDARIELDLRIGASFTRLQTLRLQDLVPGDGRALISYGSCQFPTLGFVVDRYFRVRNFKPETFWSIKVTERRERKDVNFSWKRNHLFDRATVIILFEQCLAAKTAKVTKVQRKPTSKWRPLPLTTVELQMQGSRYLRMSSSTVMEVAEKLYQKGWISYPRTETDIFDPAIDLQALIRKQTQDSNWGAYASGLLDEGKFRTPRSGRHNDKAHPPIHPVNYVTPTSLENHQQRQVYEFIVRRFLACCSDDARGEATDIEILYGPETFHTHGLLVTARNYLEVYVYDKWESTTQLPPFDLHEEFEPTAANMTEGKTTAPGYLTEPELIALMDANGIGTDATMAEHINTIKQRLYVATRPSGSGARSVDEFIPTKLGVALIKGYEQIDFSFNNNNNNNNNNNTNNNDNQNQEPQQPQLQQRQQRQQQQQLQQSHQSPPLDLSKPHLRKQMELDLRAICAGTKTKRQVVQDNVEMWREVFGRTQASMGVLRASFEMYLGRGGGGGDPGGVGHGGDE